MLIIIISNNYNYIMIILYSSKYSRLTNSVIHISYNLASYICYYFVIVVIFIVVLGNNNTQFDYNLVCIRR